MNFVFYVQKDWKRGHRTDTQYGGDLSSGPFDKSSWLTSEGPNLWPSRLTVNGDNSFFVPNLILTFAFSDCLVVGSTRFRRLTVSTRILQPISNSARG